VRDRAEQELRRITGIGISLDVPLKEQIRQHAEAFLARLLSKLAVSAGPGAIVIQLVAGRLIDPARIVSLLGAKLKAALRQKGNLVGRTERTLAGFDRLRRELNALPANAAVARVRDLAREAERALNATRYLKGDLRNARRDDLLARITAAERVLARTLRLSRFRFLLDAELLEYDFTDAIALAGRIRSDTRADVTRLAAGALPTAAACPGPFRMEAIGSLPPHDVVGQFDVRLSELERRTEHVYVCKYVRSDNPAAEAYVIFIALTPLGTPGAVPSGNCSGRRPDSHPFYHSRKRYLSVSGGSRGLFTRAAGGDEAKLKEALARAEAEGVGQACP
jgi:hypothetical protein